MTAITFETIRQRLGGRRPARLTDPQATRAAVALVLVPSGHDIEALFIRRAEVEGDPWSGHMALPGGRWRQDDADLLATAIRETEEETGIALSPGACLGELDEYTPRTPHLPRIIVRPYVFGLPKGVHLRLSDEVAEHFWLSIAELRRSKREVEFDIRGTMVKLPAFVVGQNVVWGLTERIISPFIELVD